MTLPTAHKGFTLIELSIALAIFALISVMGYQGLDSAQRAKQHTEQRMESLKSLQMALLIIQKDLEQMIDRPVRDEFGETVPALATHTDNLIEFTKTGERNLIASSSRSALKRTAYRLQEDTLLRLQWHTLDRASLEAPSERPLIADIEAINFRYLHSDGQWHEQWPPSTLFSQDTQNGTPMPKAIELTLNTKDWGEIKRLFRGIHAFSYEGS